ncbi:transcriptional regulator, AraC family [Chloroherpeton thalassium ATCC 35110]|uniref:Transcriptional regulator, AraC family n=1 Tax=Chloroherpeton thalassium (strain ATCC 35110 / GB-78) TaxID=517418 RepID=B3QXH9_CHLT3|nr:AraC family transcriptional regulator [Chloroherpeton thalassium]ACF13453.1 transcriptional regulator, AraC family [Chloroherpeton thalassium ATCC 35110]
MKIKLSHRERRDMAVEIHYPNEYGGLEEVSERLQSGKFFHGEGDYSELFFKGFHIARTTLLLKKPLLMEIDSNYQTVKMVFTFSGKISAIERQSNLQLERMPNGHNIYHMNCFQGHSFWEANKDIWLFEINIIPELFLKYLPSHNKRFKTFREKIERGETCALSNYDYCITPAMQWIIRDIVTCERTGFFKRMFLENKITELLLLQLEQISDSQREAVASLNNRLADKMMIVKEYIETRNLRSCSLSDLAKIAGTNEFTLKKAFKQMFGTTVFGYWNQLKMAEAKSLLTDGELTVSEVSAHLGYKNPQHFTRAFKRTYGTVPSKWIYKSGMLHLD